MTPANMARMADALERQAVQVVATNTYPMGDRNDLDYEPDLEPGPARHAAHLFTVAAGLRGMAERAVG